MLEHFDMMVRPKKNGNYTLGEIILLILDKSLIEANQVACKMPKLNLSFVKSCLGVSSVMKLFA